MACVNGALACLGTFVGPAGVGAAGNPGTQTQPVATIAQAQANAVFLGGGTDICLCDTAAMGPSVYTESVTMSEGISILGGYDCADWSRDISTYVTVIQGPVTPAAVTVMIPQGITSATSLDGLTVEGPDPGTPPQQTTSSTAISVDQSSPTLQNVTAHGGTAKYSYGLKVYGFSSVPTVNGGLFGASATSSVGTGSRQYGVSLSGGASGTYTGISTSCNSSTADAGVGFDCTDCGATTIVGCVLDAGVSALWGYGMQVSGSVNGLSITDTTIREGYSGSAIEGGAGIRLGFCTGSPTLTGVHISGGTGPGQHSGLTASGGGCKPIIDNSTVDGGYGGAQCVGIVCGNGAKCDVTNSTIIGTSVVNQCRPYGLVCETGGCGTISHNIIRAGMVNNTGNAGVGVSVNIANPILDSNEIVGPWCPSSLAPNPTSYLYVANFKNSSAVVTNNIFRDQVCNNGPVDVMNIEKGPAAPTVYNNTLQFATCTGCPVKRGLVIGSTNLMNPAAGIVRNNIIVNVGADGFANGYGVAETNFASGLLSFQNNDIWVQNGGILYFDDGLTPLTLAGTNALMGASSNISADPLLDATFHISTASPCRNAGTAVSAPAFDFEGNPRPQEMIYDIGADEYMP